MQFGKMLNSCRGSNDVMEIHNRQSSFHLALIHARYFQVRLIHKGCAQVTCLEPFRSQPRLDEQHTTRVQVAPHRLQRLSHTQQSFRITYRTEQAHDHVERVPEIEVHHVRAVKGDSRIAPPGDSQHLFVEIKPFDCIVSPQESKVRRCPACHVQQRVTRRLLILLDYRVDLLGFLFVILHRTVNRVVKRFGLCKHGKISYLLCLIIVSSSASATTRTICIMIHLMVPDGYYSVISFRRKAYREERCVAQAVCETFYHQTRQNFSYSSLFDQKGTYYEDKVAGGALLRHCHSPGSIADCHQSLFPVCALWGNYRLAGAFPFPRHALARPALSLLFFLMIRRRPRSTLFPYTTLFRSRRSDRRRQRYRPDSSPRPVRPRLRRSEEHTSELQSPYDLVCRHLLEKKKNNRSVEHDQKTDTTKKDKFHQHHTQ